jgi:hypothetical protein
MFWALSPSFMHSGEYSSLSEVTVSFRDLVADHGWSASRHELKLNRSHKVNAEADESTMD